MTKLEKAKEIVTKYYDKATCGIYNTRNIFGDEMTTIYKDDGLTVDICFFYAYFEVFGLSDAEFKKLKSYYNLLESVILEELKKAKSEDRK